MLKEVAVLSLFWGTVFSYEVCSRFGRDRYYCNSGSYCCSPTKCCLKSSFSSWSYIGSSGGGLLFLFGIIACCCCYMRRRNSPDTVVTAPPTQVACINTAGPAIAQPYPQAGYPLPTYGQPPSYSQFLGHGQPPSFGQPPKYDQSQTFARQQNYEPPPSYEQINSTASQSSNDKTSSDYDQLNINK